MPKTRQSAMNTKVVGGKLPSYDIGRVRYSNVDRAGIYAP